MQLFTGQEYLKIDIANNYGLDKLSWKDRLNWFENNKENLDSLLSSAKSPALYFTGLQAYRDVVAGKAIGYMISLDATSSGLQILAALTNDIKAALLCNVIDSGDRQCAYKNIYDLMLATLPITQDKNQAPAPEDVKQAVMTSLYGSKAVPKEVFGESIMLNHFYNTMQQFTPVAWKLNEYLINIWDNTALQYNWVLPDNFHVKINVMDNVHHEVTFAGRPEIIYTKENKAIKEGKSLAANLVHSIDGMIVRELTRRCQYNEAKVDHLRNLLYIKNNSTSSTKHKDKMADTIWDNYINTGYLSARIIDYINKDNIGRYDSSVLQTLFDSLPKKPFKVISIHDCFRCLPHYGNDLRKQYNLQLAMLSNSTLLANLLTQITGKNHSNIQNQNSLYNQIIDADYTLS